MVVDPGYRVSSTGKAMPDVKLQHDALVSVFGQDLHRKFAAHWSPFGNMIVVPGSQAGVPHLLVSFVQRIRYLLPIVRCTYLARACQNYVAGAEDLVHFDSVL